MSIIPPASTGGHGRVPTGVLRLGLYLFTKTQYTSELPIPSLTYNQPMLIRTFIITLLVVCVFSGCGGPQRPAGFPDLFPCDIKVTQEGEPLAEAVVRLLPESGTNEWIISGKTDAYGIAKISTHAQFAGAPAGTFKVCVSKLYETPSQFEPPADSASYGEWQEWRDKTMAEKRPRFSLVKPEFDDIAKTPFSITVSKGKTRETFDVGEAVRIPVR